MRIDRQDAAPAPRARSELVRLRATCRRQWSLIDGLSEAVAVFSSPSALRREPVAVRERSVRPGHAEAAIPLGVAAPATARAIMGRCLTGRVEPAVVETAQLIVSELVTGSIRHGNAPDGADIVVRVHQWRELCRVEVEDPGRGGVVAPQPQARSDGFGTGLALVQLVSERWGVRRDADGPIRVWALLSPASART